MVVGSGSSGSWVVRGSCLLGQIIAVYEGEPYAHMMPISEVVSGIKAVSDTASSPEVSLQFQTNSSDYHIDGEGNAFPSLEDDNPFDGAPWCEDRQETKLSFTTWWKSAGSRVGNYFTFTFRRAPKYKGPTASLNTRPKKFKSKSSKSTGRRNVTALRLLKHLAEATIFLLLFIPRLVLRGVQRCFAPFSSRLLQILSCILILMLSLTSWTISALTTSHLVPVLLASKVPTSLLALSVASSSLGTLLMAWTFTKFPSLFPSLALRKVKKEMLFFACSEDYERSEELRAVYKYLCLKHCTNLRSGSSASPLHERMRRYSRLSSVLENYHSSETFLEFILSEFIQEGDDSSGTIWSRSSHPYSKYRGERPSELEMMAYI